jgi:hypothetical protein
LADAEGLLYASPMSAILRRRIDRRAFRREVLLPVQVVRHRDFKLVSSLALDLSTDGIQVLAGERVLTGEPLLVSFQAPRTGEWFDLDATVARVIHGRRPHDRGRALGVSFDPMAWTQSLRLFEGLRGLPPAAARRAQA